MRFFVVLVNWVLARFKGVMSLLAGLFILAGCADLPQKHYELIDYDFDHQVEFKQNKLSANLYEVKVIAQKKTSFAQMSAFIFRRALTTCGSYGFKIAVLTGVEDFEQRLSFPNYISTSLKVQIECPEKVN